MKKLKYLLMTLSMIVMFMGGAYFAVPSLLLETPKDNDYAIETAVSSDENDDSNDVITEYTYKTFEDYCSENGIAYGTANFQEKTTITGSGTESDPYIVNSTNDFFSIYHTNLNTKYVELNCDVVLNDETFDEEGNPSGGDGFVYSWDTLTWTKVYLNGNNHSISGCYVNTEEEKRFSLFGTLYECKDLKIENIFLKSKGSNNSVIHNAHYIKNVHILGGTIKSKERSAGIVMYLYKEISNCTSRANVYSTVGSIASGIVAGPQINSVVKNCINYGDVESHWGTGGITGYPAFSCSFIDCENYGMIYSRSNHAGGIVGISYSESKKMYKSIKNSKNFGTILSTINSGGIVGYLEGVMDIFDCENRGTVTATTSKHTAGNITGQVVNNNNNWKTEINIIGCSGFTGAALVGSTSFDSSKVGINLLISKCSIKTGQAVSVVVAYAVQGKTTINILNCLFDVGSGSSVVLFNRILAGTINVENTMLKTQSDKKLTNPVYAMTGSSYKLNIEGFIVINSNTKQYYGEDFSGYYISWRTGKIGLVAFDGRGQFCGLLDKQQLINLGYTQIFN